MPESPARCPLCGGQSLAEILYGLPAFSEKLREDLDGGRVVLGGCVIRDDRPTTSCAACEIVIWPDGRTLPDAEWRWGPLIETPAPRRWWRLPRPRR